MLIIARTYMKIAHLMSRVLVSSCSDIGVAISSSRRIISIDVASSSGGSISNSDSFQPNYIDACPNGGVPEMDTSGQLKTCFKGESCSSGYECLLAPDDSWSKCCSKDG